MILTIEVVESTHIDGVVALVFGDHGLGIVGASGDDARLATQAALTAFWKAQDAQAQAREAQTGISTDEQHTVTHIAFTGFSIRAMLHSAVLNGDKLHISYNAADGKHTERVIHPTHVGDILVTCYDELSDEARTFRIDRIESAQVSA